MRRTIKRKSMIAVDAAERMMKNAGVGQASHSGALALSEILENIAEDIVKSAISITDCEPREYDGPRRVQGRHIELAYKLWREK